MEEEIDRQLKAMFFKFALFVISIITVLGFLIIKGCS